MSTITRFEDLIAWQVARTLTNRIFDLTERGAFSRTWSIKDQIQRSAVSVMANIAEGFERRSSRDFARFILIAKASAGETRSLIYLAADRNLVSEGELQEILHLTNRVCGILSGLRNSVLRKIP